MSKKKGQRKRRRKASKKHARPAVTPTSVLASLAALLNAAETAGTPVRFWRGGTAFTEAGVIIPPVRKGQRWEVRPLRQDPLGAPWDPDDEDG